MDPPAIDRPTDRQIASRAAFLLGWLAPQFAALALSAFRVPLWARFPQAGELLALPVMLAVQIATASILFPLFDDWTKAATALPAACPMGLIAGTLSAAPLRTTAIGELNVALWILALTAAAVSCRSPRARSVAWAVATTSSIGGALLLYLRLEFLPAAGPLPDFLVGPVAGSLRGAIDSATLTIWLPLPPLIFLLLIFSFLRSRRA